LKVKLGETTMRLSSLRLRISYHENRLLDIPSVLSAFSRPRFIKSQPPRGALISAYRLGIISASPRSAVVWPRVPPMREATRTASKISSSVAPASRARVA
jgi:hypothetical protein